MKTTKIIYLFFILLTPIWINSQNKGWIAIMSKDKNHVQRWSTRSSFPKEEIKKGWDDGFDITSLTHGNGSWALVMAKGTEYTTQKWSTRSSFPKEEIKKGWDDGFDITSLTYGNGKWALIMSKGTEYTTQKWITRSSFPKEEIKKGWDDGFNITSLTYGNGKWALIMSKGGPYGAQRWFTRNHFPEQEIKLGWNEGYRITSVSYGNGVWAIVMSLDSGYSDQKVHRRTNFPQHSIKSGWDEGYDISNIFYGVIENKAPITINPVKTKPITNLSKVIFIGMGDTTDSEIKEGVQNDIIQMTRLFQELSEEANLEFEPYNLIDSKFSMKQLNIVLDNLKTSKNDLIVFYYNGHGYRVLKQNGSFPKMQIYQGNRNKNPNLNDIYERLKTKNEYYSLMVISDACNNITGISEPYKDESKKTDGIHSLDSEIGYRWEQPRISQFLYQKSSIIVSSARPTQAAWIDEKHGGFFSDSFMDAINIHLSKKDNKTINWKSILNETQRLLSNKVRKSNKPNQTIIYKLN